MYKENDYLVYGKQVCRVEKIEKMKFNNEDYYILRPIKNNSLKISAPVSDKANKIRSLITKEDIETLISKIPSIEIIKIDDKFIESEYKKLLNNNTHEDLIKIIKTTYLRNKNRLDNNKKLLKRIKRILNLPKNICMLNYLLY